MSAKAADDLNDLIDFVSLADHFAGFAGPSLLRGVLCGVLLRLCGFSNDQQTQRP